MDVLMKELFTTPIGLLTLFTIGFIISMGLFLWWHLSKNAHEKE